MPFGLHLNPLCKSVLQCMDLSSTAELGIASLERSGQLLLLGYVQVKGWHGGV